ncbi:unnamed protein product, partial [Meganyctiphanes norvegica]
HHFTVELEASDSSSKTFIVEAFLLGDDSALVDTLQEAIGNLTEDELPQVGATGGFNFKVEEDAAPTNRPTTWDPYKPRPTDPPRDVNAEGSQTPIPTSNCSTSTLPDSPSHAHYVQEEYAVYYMCDKGYSWDAVSFESFCDSGASGHGIKPCIHCIEGGGMNGQPGWTPTSLMDEFSCYRSITKKHIGSFDWMYPNVFIVTAPAFFGLVVLILFCICFTRMNSPLYYICRDKSEDGLMKA